MMRLLHNISKLTSMHSWADRSTAFLRTKGQDTTQTVRQIAVSRKGQPLTRQRLTAVRLLTQSFE